MAGLVRYAGPEPQAGDKPLVAATMFGVTTACVERARETLERAGCEVLVFHATGNGGQAMESLIADGLIAGVLDITTTELADEHVGGFLSAGPDRLTAAGQAGIPQVVSTGALDMVNFYAPGLGARAVQGSDVLPAQRQRHADADDAGGERADRRRASRESCRRRRARSRSCCPDAACRRSTRTGQPFDDPGGARGAPRRDPRRTARASRSIELDLHINDPEFADAAAHRLLDLMKLVRRLR